MAKYRKKPVVVEASQWFKNGDHPEVIYPMPNTSRKADIRCEKCLKAIGKHGWIDTLEGGHIVCPADWIIIEAVQLRWDTWDEMCAFAGIGKLTDGKPEGQQDGEKIGLNIPTPEGLMHAGENDWIIKGVKGKFYPCKPDIFEQTYEKV